MLLHAFLFVAFVGSGFALSPHSFLQAPSFSTMSSGLTKSQRKRHNQSKEWKQDVPTEDEADVIEEWLASRPLATIGGVGRRRPLHKVLKVRNLKEVRADQKRDGLFVLNHTKCNLYFFFDQAFTIQEYMQGVRMHPLTALCKDEPMKPTEEWKEELKHMVYHDHLSPHDFGMRTRLNFSCKGGYTKQGDGKAKPGERPMTHAWLEVTTKPRTPTVGWRHSQLVANMLCDICGYDFPYPNVFLDSHQGSAVGDSVSGASGSSRRFELTAPPPSPWPALPFAPSPWPAPPPLAPSPWPAPPLAPSFAVPPETATVDTVESLAVGSRDTEPAKLDTVEPLVPSPAPPLPYELAPQDDPAIYGDERWGLGGVDCPRPDGDEKHHEPDFFLLWIED